MARPDLSHRHGWKSGFQKSTGAIWLSPRKTRNLIVTSSLGTSTEWFCNAFLFPQLSRCLGLCRAAGDYFRITDSSEAIRYSSVWRQPFFPVNDDYFFPTLLVSIAAAEAVGKW